MGPEIHHILRLKAPEIIAAYTALGGATRPSPNNVFQLVCGDARMPTAPHIGALKHPSARVEISTAT